MLTLPTAVQGVRLNLTTVSHGTFDAAGNSCGVTALTSAPRGPLVPEVVYGIRFHDTSTNVGTITSFDPATGSGSACFSQYHGGGCVGAAFDSTSAILTGTGTQSFMVSDSGNRIENILTNFSTITSPFGVGGSVKETMPIIKATFIRESD
jgi:hypothetical protein